MRRSEQLRTLRRSDKYHCNCDSQNEVATATVSEPRDVAADDDDVDGDGDDHGDDARAGICKSLLLQALIPCLCESGGAPGPNARA